MTNERRVIQTWIGGKVVERAKRTGLEVCRTKHHRAHSCVDDCPSTHRAGLERDIHRAVGEAPRTEVLRGSSQSDDLGVCRGVVA